MSNDEFFKSEQYKAANKKAVNEIDNWSTVELKNERKFALVLVCLALFGAIMIIWAASHG
jgi:hypothetical protein